jgi:hypothetical protein
MEEGRRWVWRDSLDSWCLMVFVPKFSYSIKAQSLAPQIKYVIDQGLKSSVRSPSTNDRGRLLENSIFNEIRRFSKDVFTIGDENV